VDKGVLSEGLGGSFLLSLLTTRVVLLLLLGSLLGVGLRLIVLFDFLLFRVGEFILFSLIDRHPL